MPLLRGVWCILTCVPMPARPPCGTLQSGSLGVLIARLLPARARGSLEIGDMLSDVSASPMEITLLGVQGKVLSQPCTLPCCLGPVALRHAARLAQDIRPCQAAADAPADRTTVQEATGLVLVPET